MEAPEGTDRDLSTEILAEAVMDRVLLLSFVVYFVTTGFLGWRAADGGLSVLCSAVYMRMLGLYVLISDALRREEGHAVWSFAILEWVSVDCHGYCHHIGDWGPPYCRVVA